MAQVRRRVSSIDHGRLQHRIIGKGSLYAFCKAFAAIQLLQIPISANMIGMGFLFLLLIYANLNDIYRLILN